MSARAAARSATGGNGSMSTATCSSASSASACGVGHHHGQRLADVAHLVVGNDRLLERLELRQQLLPHGDNRDGAHALPQDVGGSDHRAHAGSLERGARIDGANAAVRDRASQDDRVQCVRLRHVVDELPPAAQKAQVLQPLDRAADEGIDRAHGATLAQRPRRHPAVRAVAHLRVRIFLRATDRAGPASPDIRRSARRTAPAHARSPRRLRLRPARSRIRRHP